MIQNSEAEELASKYLAERDIAYVQPGTVKQRSETLVEVIFLVPESLEPEVAVVDPPDVRVLVNLETSSLELVYQM